jgi:uncharacterized protein
MLFALVAADKPDHLATRLDARPAHVAFLERLNAGGALAFAGPFLDAGGKPCGSLVVVKAETIEAAQAMLAADPYQAAGLFAEAKIQPWTWTFNKPEGL